MKIIITVLRMAVGWHFLYEGIAKLVSADWTARTYLLNTSGLFSSFYQWLAGSPVRLEIVDFLNIYGLILIGIALFLGLFIRFASISGLTILVLYYFAYPPYGFSLVNAWDSHLFIVNMMFIEAVIMLFLFIHKEKGYSIDALIAFCKSGKRDTVKPQKTSFTRRETLKNLVSIPVLGLMGAGAYRGIKTAGIDGFSGATIRIDRMELDELKGALPKGKIGNLGINRLILGGNLITGSAHARDLKYVGKLFKAYNSERKVFETLMLAENAGINTISIGFTGLSLVAKYKKLTQSKIQVLAQVGAPNDSDNIFGLIEQAIDYGVDALQIVGFYSDWCVRDNKLDVLDKMLSRIRSEGYVAGMGAHTIDSLITCEENGIIPDYYMTTMHHDNYWSAHPRENRKPFEVDGKRYLDHNMFHDNCFCLFPDRTIEFVNRIKTPVVGYKVLAAGAIDPKDGFNWAFKNGADFICVGMFDFQIVEDVNICLDTLINLKNRKRMWC